MGDLVVTVPKQLWLDWIAEGDAVGEPATGIEWAYWVGTRPYIEPGERLYVVSWGMLRGYAPVTRVVQHPDNPKRWGICREGGAVACKVHGMRFDGFRGFQKRWWPRDDEVPFPDWKTDLIPKRLIERAQAAGMVLLDEQECAGCGHPRHQHYVTGCAVGSGNREAGVRNPPSDLRRRLSGALDVLSVEHVGYDPIGQLPSVLDSDLQAARDR